MKNYKIKLFVALFASISVMAQKIDSLNTVSHEQITELTGDKSYRNRVSIFSYKTMNGNLLSLGDTLIIGKPSNANNLSEDFSTYGGSSSNHTNIFLGGLGAALLGTAQMGNQNMANDVCVISKMMMTRTSKNNDFKISAELRKPNGSKFLSIHKKARTYLQAALNCNEIINPNRKMNRKEAIEKLKEAKELVDIGIMSAEDYEKLKLKLSPIIKP